MELDERGTTGERAISARTTSDGVRASQSGDSMKTTTLPLIAYSHLRWDFVFQRPQQILSRMARSRPVLFVEEPIYTEDAARLDVSVPAPNILRCVPHGALAGEPFSNEQIAMIAPLLARLVESTGYRRHVAWMYTPMALPLARRLAPAALVYDCMDELSLFQGASSTLRERESDLFAAADVVFTGGPSLYRAKRGRHPNVHCFPSSVDVAHFAKARTPRASNPRPRLGFFGVIDERLDRELLGAVAAARPEWQFIMLGPIVKIDPASLPRPENILYLGQRDYDALPAYLSDWDVCLMPFALNDATRFISPTKVLEYMAAERPIVSTPIADVVEPYGDIVRIASSPDAFVAACEAALIEPPRERARRFALMREVLTRTSWDATVSQMAALVDDLLHPKGELQWQSPIRSSSAPVRPA
jgi:UDP-galactopyranose mutase